MLEKVDLTKKVSKEAYKEKMEQLEVKLGRLQRECKALGIPVLIIFEGFGAAGKGLQIGRLIQSMDPRGFEVHPIKNETEEGRMHPFMWRFWTKTPARGRIAIFDGSWYRRVLIDRFEKRTKSKDLPAAFHSINSFEQQLAEDGNLQIEKVKRQNAEKKAEEPAAEKELSGGDDPVDRIAQEADEQMRELQVSILSKADLSLSYSREEYKEKIDKLQKKLDKLHGELYRRRIPVVLGFEGWDAGGKGGAIKRLTERMDPRGYVVNPTASPNDIEKAHHYLWRFWRAMPKDGHVAIFDRTWYGRVMVERIEGFCTTEEWKRAYREINDMEKDLYDAGAIVIKFWMHIDKDEQERRFKERQENPEKQWKITDEDWRNREKWDQYEDAVNEMLMRTSTDYAPWVVVEGNSKYYARVKVLKTVVDAIEARLKEV